MTKWHVTEDGLSVVERVKSNGGCPIRDIAESPSPNEWSEETANLIASAPSLKEALATIAGYPASCHPYENAEVKNIRQIARDILNEWFGEY